MSQLYLIPCNIHEEGFNHLPKIIESSLEEIEILITERARTSRRFIKKLIPTFDLNRIQFIELDKHDSAAHFPEIKKAFSEKRMVGLMSEAGCPCIADPGGQIVSVARNYDYRIHPLTGPSSILLGLMASGMNGQQFTFHGYLPIKTQALSAKLKEISRNCKKDNSTQIFIETPYRNVKLLEGIKKYVSPELSLSISQNLSGPDGMSQTKKINEWQTSEIEKVPATFFIGKILN